MQQRIVAPASCRLSGAHLGLRLLARRPQGSRRGGGATTRAQSI